MLISVSVIINRFNPRTREGCDVSTTPDIIGQAFCFNPRTREGCDRLPEPLLVSRNGFNPRTREGCD